MDPTKFRPNDDGTLWGFSTLERTRRLGQQTYQRALKNHAAWMKPKRQGSATNPVHQQGLQWGACPICGKSVEPNLQLESAFCNVRKMMHQISQTCQKYYCSKEGEPQTMRDTKHCMKYHCSNTEPASQTTGSREIQMRNTANEDLYTSEIMKSTFVHSPQQQTGTKSGGQTSFDIAASLPSTKKVKHVRFSPGETLEVHFCV
ncbi:A-kinase-interacting protein 1-like [Ostrea edulis]|uniref:A-kinase-interacting protein 1-like n=1 Tax=Ostrea edulis TaxID=37623 RepID=UPI0024AF2383|nr:A-kinase-interacting protein 1-like [Ostrea edulis]